MKNTFAYILYLSIGGLSMLLLVASRTPSLAWKFVDDDAKVYGDLYKMCRVRQFKIPKHIDKPASQEDGAERPMGEARVVFFGDSFLEEGFGKRFERETGVPCCTSWSTAAGRRVTDALDRAGMKKDGRTRYLVFEWVERNTTRLDTGEDTGDSAQPGQVRQQASHRPALDLFNEEVRRFTADRRGVEYLLTNNPPMAGILEFRNSFRFSAFGEMPPSTPVYRTDTPMLFYRGEVGFNRIKKSSADVTAVADKLAAISRTLRERYGLKTIFMPVPNKYTLYGYGTSSRGDVRPDESYDGFLPKLYCELAGRGETCVDLYHPFKVSDKRLYYSSDTHWNEYGMGLAASCLREVYDREDARARR